jgi:hypothetical protein
MGNAQTPLIAHKSHTGTSNSYLIAANSNFGQIKVIPETLDQNTIQSKPVELFIPLNDSTILKRTTSPRNATYNNPSNTKTDTLPNKNHYTVFEFRQKYEDSINQLRLEKNKFQYETQDSKPTESINPETTPVKKKKKSYLLFLFGITGGGMLLTKLFGKYNVSHPSIV